MVQALYGWVSVKRAHDSGAAEDFGRGQKDAPGHGRVAALTPQKLAEVDTAVQNSVKISTIHKNQRRVAP